MTTQQPPLPCKTIAVILAAGKGERCGTTLPKQFMPLGNCPMLEHSIRRFSQHKSIHQICLVIPAQWKDYVYSLELTTRYPQIGAILEGGDSRMESVQKAIAHYANLHFKGNFLLHDGARPFVSDTIITHVVQALEHNDAVGVVTPCSDTLYRMDWHAGRYLHTEPRVEFGLAQTPQGFQFSLLAQAYALWQKESLHTLFTDEISLIGSLFPRARITLVSGESINFKVTSRDDLSLAQHLITLAKESAP